MRVALAGALFIEPDLLMLDEVRVSAVCVCVCVCVSVCFTVCTYVCVCVCLCQLVCVGVLIILPHHSPLFLSFNLFIFLISENNFFLMFLHIYNLFIYLFINLFIR